MLSKYEWEENRSSEHIIYCFADGTTKVITMDDYLREHPEHTAEDFKRIKQISDEMYRTDYHADQRYSNWKADEDFDHAAALLASMEELPLDRVIRLEHWRTARQAAHQLLRSGRLTPVQRRRFIAYFIHGKSLAEITREENIHHKSTRECILRLTERLRQFA